MIGQVFGNYKIEQKLGEGGMGAVFRGVDMMLEREVAIKFLRPELASQQQVVERFRSEAVTLAKLNHPNIATLYSFMRQGDSFVMVLEYVRGVTLDHVIQQRGAIPHGQAIPIFCQVLDGIQHAHEFGVIHRDIKPANMMLTEKGTLKVLDFGIARILGTARMTRQGNVIGTIEYMSPEQVKGQETDARADIYSLGMLLYEMLTGRVPFEIENEFELMKAQIEQYPVAPRQLNPSIPEVVEQAVWRAVAKDPAQRFQSADQFRDFLLAAGYAATGRLDPVTQGDASPYATRQMAQPPLSNPPAGYATSPSQPGAPPSHAGVTHPSQPGFGAPSQPGPASHPGAAPAAGAADPLAATLISPPPAANAAAPKETRIGPAPAAGAQANRGAMKETRMGPAPSAAAPGAPPHGFAPPPPHGFAPPQAGRQAPPPSFFSKLTWVHYAGAGVAVLVLFGVLLGAGALVLFTGGKAEPKPSALTERPARPVEQPAAPPPAPEVAQPAPVDQGVIGTEVPAGAGATTPPAPAGKPDLTVKAPVVVEQPSSSGTQRGNAGAAAASRPAPPRPAPAKPKNNDAAERRRRSLEALDQ